MTVAARHCDSRRPRRCGHRDREHRVYPSSPSFDRRRLNSRLFDASFSSFLREVVTDEDHKYLSFSRSPPPRSPHERASLALRGGRKKKKEKRERERERERERMSMSTFWGCKCWLFVVLSVKQNEERKKKVRSSSLI